MPVAIARTTSGNQCPRGPVKTARSRCSSSSNKYRTRLLFSGSSETSAHGFLSVRRGDKTSPSGRAFWTAKYKNVTIHCEEGYYRPSGWHRIDWAIKNVVPYILFLHTEAHVKNSIATTARFITF